MRCAHTEVRLCFVPLSCVCLRTNGKKTNKQRNDVSVQFVCNVHSVTCWKLGTLTHWPVSPANPRNPLLCPHFAILSSVSLELPRTSSLSQVVHPWRSPTWRVFSTVPPRLTNMGGTKSRCAFLGDLPSRKRVATSYAFTAPRTCVRISVVWPLLKSKIVEPVSDSRPTTTCLLGDTVSKISSCVVHLDSLAQKSVIPRDHLRIVHQVLLASSCSNAQDQLDILSCFILPLWH